ncbi:MAG: NUDIX domain-containing protein [Lachnospiraceae bacterium]|nr:NUDIX domain-containing protein [Lachnospiraceae bacterium]
MKNTTLGYIEFNECYLMLYRNIDKSDGSLGKWLGVGGKFETGETADECFIREVCEETGIKLSCDQITLRGIVDFSSNNYEDERMYLYTACVDSDWFSPSCNEGALKWINKKDILTLNMWEGDHVFLEKLLANDNYFELSLIYGGENGDDLKDIIDEKLMF